jgi:hypothetical protein
VPEVVSIRDYEPHHHTACHALWVELTEHHRRIYGDPTIGGDDPGGDFDTYLATAERVATWAAIVDGRVVGLTGLLDRGVSGEIEPVVVTAEWRGQGSYGPRPE